MQQHRAASQSDSGEVGLCVPTLGATATQGSRSPLICQIKDLASATEGCFVALVLVVFPVSMVKGKLAVTFIHAARIKIKKNKREKNDQPFSP